MVGTPGEGWTATCSRSQLGHTASDLVAWWSGLERWNSCMLQGATQQALTGHSLGTHWALSLSTRPTTSLNPSGLEPGHPDSLTTYVPGSRDHKSHPHKIGHLRRLIGADIGRTSRS